MVTEFEANDRAKAELMLSAASSLHFRQLLNA